MRTVSPVDATGAVKASYRITKNAGHGTCQVGSYQTGTAYRCSTPETAHTVLDPCWPLATPASTMVCQAKPWRHELIKLTVTGAAAGGPGFHAVSLPWGMRIGAKVRCLRDVGSVRRLNGHALLYHCSRHRDVFGPLHDSGSRWTAHVYRTGAATRSGYRSLGWQHVAVAWRGNDATPIPTPTPTPTPSASPLG